MDEASAVRTHVLDQMESSLRDRAKLAGHYYRSLRSNGVPRILAAYMVKDWHWWLHTPDCCCDID